MEGGKNRTGGGGGGGGGAVGLKCANGLKRVTVSQSCQWSGSSIRVESVESVKLICLIVYYSHVVHVVVVAV